MHKLSVNQKLEILNVTPFPFVHVELLAFLIYLHILAQQSEIHGGILPVVSHTIHSTLPKVVRNVIPKTEPEVAL